MFLLQFILILKQLRQRQPIYWLNPEDKKMFVASYVIVVAFHPFFNFERILIQRSVSHPKKELISVNYLTAEQFFLKQRK